MTQEEISLDQSFVLADGECVANQEGELMMCNEEGQIKQPEELQEVK